jgi:hypothetical protein
MATRKRTAKTDMGTVRRATTDLHRGMKMMAEARRALARATRAGAPYVVVAAELRWAHELLQARAEALKTYPGVAGYGLGRVIKDGKPTGKLCITVFVRKKLTPAELKRRKRKLLPRSLSVKGKRIRVDVVEIGEIARNAFVGASLGPTNDPRQREGTIGAFATDGATHAAVAITAMHVSGLKLFPDGQQPPEEFSIPSPLQQDPNMTRLGVLTFGTMVGVDAAKIELDDPDTASQEVPELGAVQGWRPVAIPGDEGLAVAMFGAVSELRRGRVIHPDVALPQDDLDAALVVDIATQPGDSGAALLDPNNHVIGFLVGEATSGPYAGKCIFTSAAAVVDALNCDF